MSKINGDKARTAVQKRHATKMREKARRLKAEAATKTAAAPKKS